MEFRTCAVANADPRLADSVIMCEVWSVECAVYLDGNQSRYINNLFHEDGDEIRDKMAVQPFIYFYMFRWYYCNLHV